MTKEMSIDDIEQRWKDLTERRDTFVQNKTRVETILDARQKALKEAIAACKAAGLDPDTLVDDIIRAKEVLSLKLDTFSADLASAEEMLAPMLKEIG